jgi:uncharacterized protein (DUF2236 family)
MAEKGYSRRHESQLGGRAARVRSERSSMTPQTICMMPRQALERTRWRVRDGILHRVAGPARDDERQRIHLAPGPRWFAEDRPIRRVHGDSAMFVGGLRALLLQSLHPLAMAAVEAHSGYRGDPWGRLQRTSTFLAVTTFGTAADAEQAVDRVRKVHARIRGTAPDGRPYRAGDPWLLRWVHVAEVDSFLHCHQAYGRRPLGPAQCDAYVADTARVAGELGVADPPRDRAALEDALRSYRDELVATPQARAAARFLLLYPPIPLIARPAYALLAAAAVASLPRWARRELRLPKLPVVEDVLAAAAGDAVVGMLNWVMSAPDSDDAA